MFVLQPKPTFKAQVSIPVPGGTEGKIVFEFKRLGKKALRALFSSLQEGDAERDDAEVLMEIIETWHGVDTPFDREALEVLCDSYPGAVQAILVTYNKEMLEGKAKN